MATKIYRYTGKRGCKTCDNNDDWECAAYSKGEKKPVQIVQRGEQVNGDCHYYKDKNSKSEEVDETRQIE